MVLIFSRPRAFLWHSWHQVAIFIDVEFVLAALGCLPGLSWEGLWAVLASSRAYLGLSCGSLLLSSGCLGSPALPVQDLSKICARSVQDLSKICPRCLPQMPVTKCRARTLGMLPQIAGLRTDGRRWLPQRGFQLNPPRARRERRVGPML